MLFKWFLLSSITFAYNSLFIEYKSHSTIRDNNNEIMNSNNNILIKKLFCFLNCLDYINAWPMDKEKINKIKELFIYTVKKKLLIFYALNFFVILFLIYYLSLFYIIYKKMFIEWLIDCIITNLIWVIVSFVLCCIVKIFDWGARLFRTRGMINYIN